MAGLPLCGPALVAWDRGHHRMYWAGPGAGAALAALSSQSNFRPYAVIGCPGAPANQVFPAFAFSATKFLKSMSVVITSSIRKNTISLRKESRAIWFSPAIFANSIM